MTEALTSSGNESYFFFNDKRLFCLKKKKKKKKKKSNFLVCKVTSDFVRTKWLQNGNLPGYLSKKYECRYISNTRKRSIVNYWWNFYNFFSPQTNYVLTNLIVIPHALPYIFHQRASLFKLNIFLCCRVFFKIYFRPEDLLGVIFSQFFTYRYRGKRKMKRARKYKAILYFGEPIGNKKLPLKSCQKFIIRVNESRNSASTL